MSNDGLTGPKSTQKLTEHSSASSTLNSSVDSITLDNGNFTLSLHAEYLSVNGISTRGDAVVIESRVGNGPVDVRISPDETESYCCGLLHRKSMPNFHVPFCSLHVFKANRTPKSRASHHKSPIMMSSPPSSRPGISK